MGVFTSQYASVGWGFVKIYNDVKVKSNPHLGRGTGGGEGVGISIDKCITEPSHFARNIGVIFDNKLNMERQVSAICKAAFFASGIFRGLERFCS